MGQISRSSSPDWPRLFRLARSRVLFALRTDIGGEIGRLAPAQGKIRHLRVRVEQEEGDLFRREIRLARDCGKRGSVGAGLILVAVDNVAGGALALGEIGSMVSVSGHR
jgi:hypothetical protein